ncbi:hypothetical protein N658DRAFT_496247 [Parathielavia hyrcaniae]|uniref:Antifreeze protein n=1 Tax=Parathielavia hyrcaniae TaxID=113614 RepID=A0AAN6Q0U5_9PEZI|nr:hypothetical protein N658DRAFT_496247 [Parathielavia hyrcaniae]
MQFTVALLSLASLVAGAALDARGDCHGNNCNRAVTGTRPGLLPFSDRSSSCSSFLLTTVTPAATTVTVTVDEEDLPTPTGPAKRDQLMGRQMTVVPSSIPEFAENCADAAEFASACTCFGVTGSVTTMPTPTVTITTTVDYCEDI